MMSVVDEAMDRSPTAARHVLRALKMGYEFVWAQPGQGSATDHNNKLVAIDRSLTRENKVMQVMYESGNVVNEDLFTRIRRDRAAGRFASGEAYARAVLDAESTTAVYAAMKAVEAGLTYSRVLDPLVRAATRPDSSGALIWRSERAKNEVFARAAQLVWTTAQVTDQQGRTVPAREFYARGWVGGG